MSQYIFVEDYIILKSEIVSVQFDFQRSTSRRFGKSITGTETVNYWGDGTIVFILKDGSTRIISRHFRSNTWDEIKADVIEQMKIESKPNTSKTATTTTIRKVPVNSSW